MQDESVEGVGGVLGVGRRWRVSVEVLIACVVVN